MTAVAVDVCAERLFGGTRVLGPQKTVCDEGCGSAGPLCPLNVMRVLSLFTQAQAPKWKKQ